MEDSEIKTNQRQMMEQGRNRAAADARIGPCKTTANHRQPCQPSQQCQPYQPASACSLAVSAALWECSSREHSVVWEGRA